MKKVHLDLIKFNQNPWLNPKNDMNTKLRKKAKNNFEKNFFKLKNNTVSGNIWKMWDNIEILNLWQQKGEEII